MRSVVYLLVLLALLTLFAGLGRPAISDSDEAFYAEAGREMLAGGDWLTPHYNYENRFQKPILFYWVVAAAYGLVGVDETAARLGSAFAGLGIVLLTLACGRRWYDEATGLLGAAIVATSFGAVAAARLSLPDLPLAFFITLATWSAFVALFDKPHPSARPGAPRARGEGRRPQRWWVIAGLAAGLGFLTKGPVAVVIPGLVLLGPFFLERGWRRLNARDVVLATVVFLLVAAPWYLAMTRVHGTAYLWGFFVGDNLERFATTAFNPHRPLYFYVPIVLGGMLPWSPFFALGAQPLWRRWKRRERPARPDIRLLWWAAVPFLLFTVSVGKQPRYILPMLAPLGLLLALAIRRAVTTPESLPDAQPRLFRGLACGSGALIALLAVLLWRARPLLYALPAWRVSTGALLLVLSGLGVILMAASRHWRRVPIVLALAAAVFVLVLRYAVLDVPGLDPVEQMANRVLTSRQAGEPVASYRVFVRNLVFYTHVAQVDLYTDGDLVEYLNRPDRVLCVLPQRELTRLQQRALGPDAGALPATLSRLQQLGAITYFDAATAKIGTALWPNVEEDLQTAVLVANR